MNNEILKNVYVLAKERYQESITEAKDRPLTELSDILEKREKNKLLQYLNSLTYEENLMIAAVMYIGRDCSDKEFFETPNIFEERLKEMKNTFSSNDILINQIYGKLPLHKYLENAFRLFGINLNKTDFKF